MRASAPFALILVLATSACEEGAPVPVSGAATVATTSGQGPGCQPPVEPDSGGACVVLTVGVGGGTGGTGGTGGSGGTGGGAATGGAGGAAVGVTCNPVTNAPCATGSACDVVLSKGEVVGFRCFGPPNDVPICGACDGLDGPWCAGGATCAQGSCRRYCCGDADCGPDASCVTSEAPSFAPELGLCLPDV